MNILKFRSFDMQVAVVVMLSILIAFTPTSAKAINLAWILVVVFVVFLPLSKPLDFDPGWRFSNLRIALYSLMAFFMIGLSLKIGMELYWGEQVHDISFELTSTVAVVLSLIIVGRYREFSQGKTFLAIALSVASLLALWQGYKYTYVAHPGPTNPVNWGAGIALFMCLGVAVALHKNAMSHVKLLSLFALVFFSLAIFVAGRRGAFFAILWVFAVGGYHGFRHAHWWRSKTVLGSASFIVALFAVAAILAPKENFSLPFDRVKLTMKEVSRILSQDQTHKEMLESTLGGRIVLLTLGSEAILSSPVFGVGNEVRTEFIGRADEVLKGSLFHFHNEYLHAWVGYGIPGLLGALCFPVGLFVAGMLARRESPAIAVALTGMGLVHFVSGLTNVNTFHNYYGTVFAVCVVIPFLFFRLTPMDNNELVG